MKAKDNKPTIYNYAPIKNSKTATTFELQSISQKPEQSNLIFTSVVRLEVFQGFSKAKNLVFYFKLRDNPNWKKCTSVTGLFRTINKNIFIGDLRNNRQSKKSKTLLIFRLCTSGKLQIFRFPSGFYPTSSKVDDVVTYWINNTPEAKEITQSGLFNA